MYVELPEVGASVKAGATFGVVESVKAASDVYSPVSGTVLEKNEQLLAEGGSSLVNSSPFDDAWMLKIKLTNPAEAHKLLDAKAYAAHCEAGGH